MKNHIISGAAALFTAALLAGGAVSPAMAKSDPTTEPKPQSDQVQQESAKESKQKLYCVVDTLTGSHLRTKECRTREQWIATGFDPLEARK
jgi:hypothetical protein|nr:hypothetical protein [uncultured Sphingomonas sp.]